MSSSNQPRASCNRQRLIDAANEIFMEEGYRASVTRIAARAGVAKQTLYNHFPKKEELFGAVVQKMAAAILVSLDGGEITTEEDFNERLIQFARSLRGCLLSHHGLACLRTLSAESARFPELCRSYLEKGPEQTARRLTHFLAEAMEKGMLRRDDPHFAAEILLGMLIGYDQQHHLCSNTTLPEKIDNDRTKKIVACFLRAFTP